MLPEPCMPTIINIPYYSCSSDPNNLFGLAFDIKHKYRQREDKVKPQHRKVSWHQTIMRRRGCVDVHEISNPVQKCFIEVILKAAKAKEYKSDVLNPSAEEFVLLSRHQGDGARRLSADVPVFVSPAIDYYVPPSIDSVRAGGQSPSAPAFSTIFPTGTGVIFMELAIIGFGNT
ncbi:uncharacterized protein [Triticum aestivum]|uniref:uncharacterized protein isoform X1 n=2 Tax=Triticum aestivum TaxID=4565 RepID=UPI001D030B91|nr:uncharacterized protein LOC123092245 isoform X1 [Triticum aestivum]XP_044369899.1 uncharacterized protein LOC123092245 isoform X1 [Triticum aestivum]XP_044369905.1 uncharacterized protein LOC123092245 isoform X1 [Triticum aestivum]XP_044369911.1 uncharacterized protein LOC123092245 isoform X1 [Triticum aestivum]